MASRFFPRYEVNEGNFEAFFLGHNPEELPEVIKLYNLSLSGLKLLVSNKKESFVSSKIAIRYQGSVLYFHSKVIWEKSNKDKTSEIGIKVEAPNLECFKKWLKIITEMDQRKRPKRSSPSLKEHRASLY